MAAKHAIEKDHGPDDFERSPMPLAHPAGDIPMVHQLQKSPRATSEERCTDEHD